jgi:hypothetical protein
VLNPIPVLSAISLGGVTEIAAAVVIPADLNLFAVAGPTPGRLFSSISSVIIHFPFPNLIELASDFNMDSF